MKAHRLELDGPEQTQIGGRSGLYSLLSKAFRFPTPEQYERVKSGQFADEVQQALAQLPYDGLKADPLGRGAGLSYEEFQSRYIELFDVGGAHGPPCFLYEGESGGGRMKVMEEILRFYHHFGLRLSTERRDRPDHLASELEFMHLLTFKEAESLLQGKERGAYQKAERDFLRFHLNDFVATVAEKIGGTGVPFYAGLAQLSATFCQREVAHLRAV
ncbi:MAG: molecular chaperone TorD family protein [Deltaproteobacteria bacterium]|nr:molecular chaperone TorD family protein [Deltaproteobacteria bacterium]